MNLVVQPNQEVVVIVYAYYRYRSITVNNQDPYPCTSNIGVSCQFMQGKQDSRCFWMDHIVVRFTDNLYATTKFHVLIPDVPYAQYNNYHWYHVGVYDKVTKNYDLLYSGRHYRQWNYWTTSVSASAALTADIVGKAGSYRQNVSINVYNPTISTGDSSYLLMSTQWSLF